MKKFISIFLCIAIIVSLSACSFSGGNAIFSIGVSDNVNSFNPLNAETQAELMLSTNCFEGLLRFDDQGKINLAGATAYTVNKHGLSYVFKLNPNAKWYADSQAKSIIKDSGLDKFNYSITAKDYVFGFQIFKEASSQLDCIKEVKATDEFTLEINLSREDYDLLHKLASLPFYPCNKDFYEAIGDAYGTSPDTILYNGPYFIEESAQSKITITRNPRYNGNIQIKAKQIHISTSLDDATQLKQFKDGLLNLYVADSATDEIKDAERSKTALDTVWGIAFNCKSKLGSSKAFREVLLSSIPAPYEIPLPAFAFERTSSLFPATYTVGDTVFSDFAYEPVLYEENTEKAQSNLKALQAKYKVKSYSVTFAAPYDMKADAEKIIENWSTLFGEKIKIKLSLYNKETAPAVAQEASYDLAIIPITTATKTANSIFYTISGAPCYYDSKDLHTLGKNIDTIASTNFNIYSKAEAHLISNSVFIPLFTTGKVLYIEDNFKGVYLADGGKLIYFHSGEEI